MSSVSSRPPLPMYQQGRIRIASVKSLIEPAETWTLKQPPHQTRKAKRKKKGSSRRTTGPKLVPAIWTYRGWKISSRFAFTRLPRWIGQRPAHVFDAAVVEHDWRDANRNQSAKAQSLRGGPL